ncbi:aminoglycoside phosphotransferase family protein [Isoptericola sp. AK164]|uniref:phosphotransferase enzyme family protein n=1 Tax=Isoptericola sp. AK164 TaxID=3024246 RepID=UPI0024186FB8|nr:aminoglycoside phosphotransferase family protein [Isoptericola sp. AK164]
MTPQQQDLDTVVHELVAAWLGPVRVVAEHSSGLLGTRVWQVRADDGTRAAVKRYAGADRHFERELAAHTQVLADMTDQAAHADQADQDRFPRLLGADRDHRLLALAWLPGRLVEHQPAEELPETYRQAGTLLARLHAAGSRVDGDWEAAEHSRALGLLAAEHRIAPATVARLRAALARHEHPPVRVVPTHGDFHPRNWVVDEDGTVRLIDFGRHAWRPPVTDLARLDAQQLAGRPDLTAAFVEGYGTDLRRGPGWRRVRLREAIAAAVWSHRVGASSLEAQGHRMIAAALADEEAAGAIG